MLPVYYIGAMEAVKEKPVTKSSPFITVKLRLLEHDGREFPSWNARVKSIACPKC